MQGCARRSVIKIVTTTQNLLPRIQKPDVVGGKTTRLPSNYVVEYSKKGLAYICYRRWKARSTTDT